MKMSEYDVKHVIVHVYDGSLEEDEREGTYFFGKMCERIRQEAIQFAIHEGEDGLMGWLLVMR